MQEPERFAVDDLAAHDLPDGTVLARNRSNGAQMVLPGEVFNAITHCDAFRTMEEQIAHLAGPQARGREGEIRQILQTVINGGLMISASEIASRLVPRQGAVRVESAVATIITCERPEALGRLLESMRTHVDLEKLEKLVVVDDSRKSESLAANREAIEASNAALGDRGVKPGQHFTAAEAAKLVESLVAELPEHERGIRFLLDRGGREAEVTTGITRNLAQLLGIGQPLMVFDDDVLCSVMDPPQHGEGVEFSARQRGCRFYASDEDWMAMRASDRRCPIQAHLDALGSTLAESLARMGMAQPGPSAFEHATPGFARRVEPDSRILVSQCGSYGDPGSAGNEWIALLPAEARAQLASLTGDIESALEHRNCWLGQSRPVFEPSANMSQLTGFDNRDYLPPYFPVFRGQDRTFGAMTEFVRPQALSVDLPFALPHLPIPRRSWREGHRGFILPFSLTHFLNDFFAGELRGCRARDPLNRNQWLAMLYQDLADAPRERIFEMTAAWWTQKRIDWLKRLSTALEETPGESAPLADFLRRALDQLRGQNIPDPNRAELKGPPSELSGDAVLDYWRLAWRDFAAGLRAWPAIREAAPQQLTS